MSILNPLGGFAIRRNGSCLASESDCRVSQEPYHACCPGNSMCGANTYNTDCCASFGNCTTTLMKKPSCANATWTLYDNAGYFCCSPGTIGYAASETFSDGCAAPGLPPKGAKLLPIVSSGQTATSSSSSTSRSAASSSSSSRSAARSSSTSKSASSTASSSSSPSPALATSSVSARPNGSSSHPAAIAGGIAGGVAAIAIIALLMWCLYRQRKKRVQLGDYSENLATRDASFHNGGAPITYQQDVRLQEKDGFHVPPEAAGVSRSELYADRDPSPVAELHQ